MNPKQERGGGDLTAFDRLCLDISERRGEKKSIKAFRRNVREFQWMKLNQDTDKLQDTGICSHTGNTKNEMKMATQCTLLRCTCRGGCTATPTIHRGHEVNSWLLTDVKVWCSLRLWVLPPRLSISHQADISSSPLSHSRRRSKQVCRQTPRRLDVITQNANTFACFVMLLLRM